MLVWISIARLLLIQVMKDNLKNQKIGVVIPFYQGDTFILECIDSLENALLPKNFILQIIITDNNSQKSNYEKKLRLKKNITYLKTKPAIGYGRACNIGAQKAIEIGSDFLCILNQDTIVDQDMLINLLEICLPEQDDLVCSPMIFNYDFIHPMEMVVTDYLLKNKAFLKNSFPNKLKSSYEIPTIGAACIFMHKTVVGKIGLYDPLLYHYGEDYDFFKRLKRVNGKLLMVPGAKLAHRASMNEVDPQKRWRNKELYEEAQLIKFIRYKNQKGYLKKTIKIAWIFLRNNKLKLLEKYLNRAFKIYLNSDKYKLPSDKFIKQRIAAYQKKDVVL